MRRYRVHPSNGRYNSYWVKLSANALLVSMQYVKFILESNSNKQLDALTKEIVDAIRKGGCVKAGPIPSKAKRLIYCYSTNTSTYNRLMAINANKYKKVSVTIESLERPQ